VTDECVKKGEKLKKYKALIILPILLAALLTSFPLNVRQGRADLPGPRIYIDPTPIYFDTTNATVGTRFNVTIWIENVTEPGLDGWQVELHYDDSIINVTQDENGIRAWPSAGRGANKFNTSYAFYNATAVSSSMLFPAYNHIDPKDGAILVADAIIVGTAWQGAKGLLCIIEFQITTTPTTQKLNCTLDITNPYTWIKPTDLQNKATFEDGYYEIGYVFVPPSLPWLEASPREYEAIKLREFNIDIVIKNVTESLCLIATQFIVRYNTTYLEAVNVIEGPFMPNSSWAIHGTFPIWFIEEDTVKFGDIILPNPATGEWDLPSYPSGEGVIATITFKPLLHSSTSFNITIEPLFDVFFFDKDGNSIAYSDSIPCTYTYNPLEKPLLSVEPALYTAHHVGETFDINITINDLDAQWNMTYAEFKLLFDNNSLQFLDVVEGDFLNHFGSTEFNHEEGSGYTKVNITLTPVGNYPSGSGTLATVRFNVTSSPGTSTLTLNDTKLLDSEMKDVLHETQDGYYQLHERLIHPITWETETFNIITVSNTSITPVPMNFNQTYKLLWFNVTGYDGTVGFVNITIPKALLNASITDWYVIVGGWPVQPIVLENATHTTLYFTFSSSVNSVYILGTWVVPEMSIRFLLLALLMISLAGFAFAKKVQLKKCKKLLPSRILFKSA
jgi:hypothetical protein